MTQLLKFSFFQFGSMIKKAANDPEPKFAPLTAKVPLHFAALPLFLSPIYTLFTA